jgi:Nuclease-related domain
MFHIVLILMIVGYWCGGRRTRRFIRWAALAFMSAIAWNITLDETRLMAHQPDYLKWLVGVCLFGIVCKVLLDVHQLLMGLARWSAAQLRRGRAAITQRFGRWAGTLSKAADTSGAPNGLNIIVLSDHTADKVEAGARQRQVEYDAKMRAHRDELAHRDEQRNQCRRRIASAWQDRHIVASLFHAACLGLLHFKPTPVQPQMRGAGTDEIKWASGREGEQRVIDHWSHLFSERWTLICGYHNRAGEIDQILVGPSGVFAIEVKYINGTVYCDGDRWWRDKYDNYGNRVEQQIPIIDRGGRSPSGQVNAAADVLQRCLAQQGVTIRVYRMVVLSHPKSRVGRMANLTVDWVGYVDWFNHKVFAGTEQSKLDDAHAQRVVAIIQRDHDHYARRQGTGPTDGKQTSAKSADNSASR